MIALSKFSPSEMVSATARPPEGTDREIEKQNDQGRRYAEFEVLWPADRALPHPPQGAGKGQRGHEKQNPGHFQPKNGSDAHKRPNESAHTARHRCGMRRRGARRCELRGSRPGDRAGNGRNPMACRVAHHACADSQKFAQTVSAHSDLMVAATAGKSRPTSCTFCLPTFIVENKV